TVIALPTILRADLRKRQTRGAATGWEDRVRLRYREQETAEWMFAWFKLRLDPMFRELPEFLKSAPPPNTVLDIGCGRGIVGCALLEWFPDSRIHGMDPNPSRVRIATRAFGDRGQAIQ